MSMPLGDRLSQGFSKRLERSWWQPGLTPLSAALLPLSGLYALAWWLREKAYAWGWFKVQRLPVPVVVVGNLIVGGAGKTPTVMALLAALQRDGWLPAVVSRGYAPGGRHGDLPRAVLQDSSAAEMGDEPLLIKRRSGVPVWVGRDRVAVGRALLAAHPDVNILLSDDGLQHRALARDHQVIVFDERGLGNGLLLPAGPLRQALARHVPPHSSVVYNAPAPSTPWPGHLARRSLAGALPLRAWWAGSPTLPALLQALGQAPLVAAAGLAAPERFFAMLRGAGLRFSALPLPDHAPLNPRPWPAQTPAVLLTEKDAVKIDPQASDAAHIFVATLDFQLDPATLAALREALTPFKPTPNSPPHRPPHGPPPD